MIDLNRIRSVKTLEEMKADLTEFLVNPEIKDVYVTDYGWSEDDYVADREQVEYMLDKVKYRLSSLIRFNNQQKKLSD